MSINRYATSSLLLLLTFVVGCTKKVEKNVRDYYPEVATVGVSIQPDGGAKVTGNVISAGSGELQFVGFCMDENPHPQMHINQKLVKELDGTTFSAIYGNLDATKRYYVRSFAANENGYSYGEDVVIERPVMDTSMVPCHPGTNTIMVVAGSSTKYDTIPGYNIDALDPIRHDFTISSSNNSWHMDFEFNRTPTSGKYTIWGTSGGNENTVTILFSDPNQGSYYMENGGEIYVQQIGVNRIKVWMCHQNAFFDWYVTTSFSTK